jgi:SAM-dependent methyltransferase
VPKPDAGPRRSGGGPTKTTLRKSWNALSFVYRPPRQPRDLFGHDKDEYLGWLRPVVEALPEGARVLDLGCGTGVPACRFLAKKFDVTGVDLSDVMIRRARRLVPKATFLRADMTEVAFAKGEFAAVIALYSVIHVPLEEQRPLFRRIRTWLTPGGWFVAILGHGALEGWERGWLGTDVKMFWSHANPATYRRWLSSTGFDIVEERFVPEGEGGHELFLCRTRPDRGRPPRKSRNR